MAFLVQSTDIQRVKGHWSNSSQISAKNGLSLIWYHSHLTSNLSPFSFLHTHITMIQCVYAFLFWLVWYDLGLTVKTATHTNIHTVYTKDGEHEKSLVYYHDCEGFFFFFFFSVSFVEQDVVMREVTSVWSGWHYCNPSMYFTSYLISTFMLGL